MITRNELKNSLPHGSRSVIAAKAGVSVGAITRFLNGEIKSSKKIEKVVMEYVIEYQTEKNQLQNKLKKVFAND